MLDRARSPCGLWRFGVCWTLRTDAVGRKGSRALRCLFTAAGRLALDLPLESDLMRSLASGTPVMLDLCRTEIRWLAYERNFNARLTIDTALWAAGRPVAAAAAKSSWANRVNQVSKPQMIAWRLTWSAQVATNPSTLSDHAFPDRMDAKSVMTSEASCSFTQIPEAKRLG